MNKDMTINELMSSLKKQYNFHYEKTQTISKLLGIIKEATEIDLQVQEVFKEENQEEAREFFRDDTLGQTVFETSSLEAKDDTYVNEEGHKIAWHNAPLEEVSEYNKKKSLSFPYPYKNDRRSTERSRELWNEIIFCLEQSPIPLTCRNIGEFIKKRKGNDLGYYSLATSVYGQVAFNEKVFKQFSPPKKVTTWGLKRKKYNEQ